ncbi:MAG: hypothetical protein KBG02_02480, partial [Haliscomenobacter sp.]|nr:hypothetical protein [Haliscomenobacter sp.]
KFYLGISGVAGDIFGCSSLRRDKEKGDYRILFLSIWQSTGRLLFNPGKKSKFPFRKLFKVYTFAPVYEKRNI